MGTEEFFYVVGTRKGFDEAVVSVLRSVEKKGWTVFQIYDIKERLAAKGFEVGRTKIVEICSAKYASRFIGKNELSSLCLPCKINVIEKNGKVMIACVLPRMMAAMFPGIAREETEDAEAEVKEIVDGAR